MRRSDDFWTHFAKLADTVGFVSVVGSLIPASWGTALVGSLMGMNSRVVACLLVFGAFAAVLLIVRYAINAPLHRYIRKPRIEGRSIRVVDLADRDGWIIDKHIEDRNYALDNTILRGTVSAWKPATPNSGLKRTRTSRI